MSITLFPMRGAVLTRFVELIGPMEMIRLSIHSGGRALYIPKRVTAESRLLQAVSLVSAERLALRLGGCSFPIPSGVGRKARIVELRKRRLPIKEIAAIAGGSERFVYNILAEYKALGGPLNVAYELTDGEVGLAVDTPLASDLGRFPLRMNGD